MSCTSFRSLSRVAIWCFAFVVVAITLSSCSKSDRLTGPLNTAPVANSPQAAVRRLEWAFDHRDARMLEVLLTQQVEFTTFSNSTNGPIEEVWNRDRLLMSVGGLFEGTPTGAQAALSIELDLEPELVALADPRFESDPSLDRVVRVSAHLRVTHAEGGVSDVMGFFQIGLTRGGGVGTVPSTRWQIRDLMDETVLGGGDVSNQTFASVLSAYWNPR